MNRPLYETKQDLENEQSMAKKIATAYGFRLRKLHMKHFLDFMGFDSWGRAVAVVEVKRRKQNHNDFPFIILSLTKFNKGLEFYKFNDLCFIFAVEFNDGLFAYEYQSGDSFKIIYGGRTDRGDKQDQEPVVQIPTNRMERI